jgi:hypothetical protein
MYSLILIKNLVWIQQKQYKKIENHFFHLIEAAKTSQSVNHLCSVKKSTDLRLLRPVQDFSLLMSLKKKNNYK